MTHKGLVRGVTLIELMVALAVFAIVATIAVPSMQTLVQNNRISSQANNLLTAITFARSEAVKRRAAVTVCPRGADNVCGTDWTDGWLVYLGADGADPAGNVIRRGESFAGGTTITGGDVIPYAPDGRLDSAAVTLNLSIPNCTGDRARQISINAVGRAQVQAVAC